MEIPVQNADGQAPSFTDLGDTGPHWYRNDDGRTVLLLLASSSRTWTVEARGETGEPDLVISHPGSSQWVPGGPFDNIVYADRRKRVWFTLSSVSGTARVIALRLQPAV
jgi:hypothetical protein